MKLWYFFVHELNYSLFQAVLTPIGISDIASRSIHVCDMNMIDTALIKACTHA